MTSPTQQRGQHAEDQACKHLQQKGLCLIGRNHRCRWGELDLIMMANDTLVVVEVKSRKTPHAFKLYPPISKTKQQRILLATEHFLMQHAVTYTAIRFDVVALVGLNVHQWCVDAFRAETLMHTIQASP